MIKEKSIEQIQELDLVEVVSRFSSTHLKKAGVNYTGPCPWHNEKTPSFVVSKTKNICKCFGCGKAAAGNISFVMATKNLDFVDAIEAIAHEFNIELEYFDDGKTEEQRKKEKDEVGQMQDALQLSQELFRKELFENRGPSFSYLENRGFSNKTIIEWELGFAPAGGNFVKDKIIAKELYAAGVKAGVIKTNEGKTYDFFQDRLMFPIHDRNGLVIGFGGRTLSSDKKQAKYINSPESPLYNKTNVLYGFHRAVTSIQKTGNAYLVEGYLDVIRMHEYGFTNTIAGCGTAFTSEHAKKIKKFAQNVTLLADGDIAGRKATFKAIDVFLAEGLNVFVIELPEEHDPDSFLKTYGCYTHIDFQDYFQNLAEDGILFKAKDIFSQARSIPEKSAAIKQIGEMINLIKDETTKTEYGKATAKELGIAFPAISKHFTKETKEEKKKVTLAEGEFYMPSWAKPKRDQILQYGFIDREEGKYTGYYFAPDWEKPITNFIIQPLFHLYGNDNKRLFRVTNGMSEWKVVEVDSKDFISTDKILAKLYEEGFYMALGTYTKHHHMKLVSMLGQQFPLCYEITEMGWQPEGFFAFSNAAYHEKLDSYSDIGTIKIKEKHYFMPVAGVLRNDYREGDDVFENDRYLKHVPTEVTFSQWANQMILVYKDAAYTAIAFALMTIFKDIVMKTTKIPILYAYGPVGSGKSEYGESITYLFFSGKDADGNLIKPFNLNQGTEFAFFNRIGRYKNCPAALNEFDEDKIEETRFRAIKGSWDGEGRERGTGKKNKAETQKVNTTVILMGQFLSTKDDASVLSRSIPEAFLPNNERSRKEIEDFRILKNWERKGLSGILTEMLGQRQQFIEGFPKVYAECSDRMAKEIEDEKKKYVLRILKNYSVLTATIKLMAEPMQLPFSFEHFWNICKDRIIELSSLMEESNALAEFWNTVVYLLDNRKEITLGWDFDIEMKAFLSIGDKMYNWAQEPRRILYVRLPNIHKLFAEQYRRQTGHTAINAKTIEHFFKASPAYLGCIHSKHFRHPDGREIQKTSCHVFDYDQLGVDLDRTSSEQGIYSEFVAKVLGDAKLEDLNGFIQLRWTMEETTKTAIEGKDATKRLVTYCYAKGSKLADEIKDGVVIKVTGYLKEVLRTEKDGTQKLRRNMDVTKVESVDNIPESIVSPSKITEDELPF